MSEAFARRYKLLDRIAIGGTAEVFRALYVIAGGQERRVVIKRILPQFARDERFRRLFHEEACVAVTMCHPGIVRVLDYGDLGPTCFIALELVDGKDLGTLLGAAARTGNPPSSRLAAYVAAQVAEALEFIHSQTSSEGTPLQIIHRDVSPQNILVAYTGDVKLTDFGIAKSAIRREQTVDGALRGKLDYMSPEQARLGRIDHRTDVFGLGCVLYEMLQGAPPFRGENELDTLERVREGKIAVPTVELTAPPALRQVLARALANSPEQRYQRAGEMAADLHAHLREVGAPSAENIGAWVRAVEALPAPEAASRVDDAVRRLLGDEHGDQAPGTTVFASHPATLVEAGSPDEEARPTPAARRLQVVIGALLLLGFTGWLLWAFSPGQGASAGPDARTLARPDARPPRQPDRAAPAPEARLPVPAVKLALRSQPPGAGVLVDGEPIGRTPLALPRPARTFLLEVQKEGFRPWRRRLDPGTVANPLTVTLAPAATVVAGQSSLTINTLPWSRVRLDGKVVGNTPLVSLVVRAGNHRLELLAPDGKLRKSLSITLLPDTARSFTFDFTPGKRQP